jgi:trimethylamine:corrinoid methyltransferase-like protein
MNGFHKIALECVSDEVLNKIHEASIRILENRGIVVHHSELREIAKKRGAKVENEIVFFSRSLIENAIETTPSHFDFHSRNKNRKITIGKELVLSPTHGHPFIIDEKGRRPGTLQDYINLVKLTHQLDSLKLTGGILVEPSDVHKDIRHVELMFNLFKHTDKPLIFVATGQKGSEDIIEMTAIALGCDDAKLNIPAITLTVNPISPLRWDERMSGTIVAFARNRQPLQIAPAAMIGATGPITPLGTSVLQNTEILSGIALAQMINEGTPMVIAPCSAACYMKTANFVVGSPEAILMNLAQVQLAKRYKIPCRIQGTITDAKSLDYQGGYEGSFSLLLQVLAIGKGAYVSQAVGSFDSYMTVSAEKFVADDEICKRLICILEGLEVSEENYALDTIMEIGHDGSYLTHQDTFDHFRERWVPPIANWDSYEEWERKGCIDYAERARKKATELLANYVAPELDKAVEKNLTKYVQDFKNKLS